MSHRASVLKGKCVHSVLSCPWPHFKWLLCHIMSILFHLVYPAISDKYKTDFVCLYLSKSISGKTENFSVHLWRMGILYRCWTIKMISEIFTAWKKNIFKCLAERTQALVRINSPAEEHRSAWKSKAYSHESALTALSHDVWAF